MQLIEYLKNTNKTLGMPLIGYPACKLNNSTIYDNLTNSDVQVDTLNKILNRFKPDMIMDFMDLSVEAEALGLDVKIHKEDTPEVKSHPIKESEDLNELNIPDPQKDGRMKVFTETIRKFKESNSNIPIGAYCSSPFTLTGLLMGAENLALNTIMNKEFCKKTLNFSTDTIIPYIKALEKAGADFIVPLDPTAVLISPELFEELVNPYIDMLANAVDIPIVLHVCGQTTNLIKTMCKTKVQGLSLDSMVDFTTVINNIPEDMVLIGNISPVEVMLNMNEEKVYKTTYDFLNQMKKHNNFLLSTGCDLAPKTAMGNVDAFMRALWDFNRDN